ncbi:RNA polymerase sigma factor [Planctomycetota bacterium]|nr:RNA polymerase sigma factor [Planctomycetota bacterium]
MTLREFSGQVPRLGPVPASLFRCFSHEFRPLFAAYCRQHPTLLVDDLLDAVFMNIVASVRKHGTGAEVPLGALVRVCMRNLGVDRFRRAKRHQAVSLDRAEEASTPSHENQVDAREQATEMLAHPSLTDDEREVMHLRYREGWTPTEIAQQLDIRPGLVRVRVFRGLTKLKRAFGHGEREHSEVLHRLS